MKIGVIGLGVVGKAFYTVTRAFHEEVRGYDINSRRATHTLEEVVRMSVIFIALPTPLNSKGRLDASLITHYLAKFEAKRFDGLIVIKSTLPLGFLRKARRRRLRILYSPEFLHQKKAVIETVDPLYVVMSGTSEDCTEYRKVLHWLPSEKFHVVDDRTAEMVKLATNAFAATKLSFVNEIERICRIQHADVGKVMEILRLDKRRGPEYAYPNIGPYCGECLRKTPES